MSHSLALQNIGEKTKIVAVSDLFLAEKMMEMGCLIGDEVVVLKKAPLGDPLFVQIGLSQLGLRLSEAKSISVE